MQVLLMCPAGVAVRLTSAMVGAGISAGKIGRQISPMNLELQHLRPGPGVVSVISTCSIA